MAATRGPARRRLGAATLAAATLSPWLGRARASNKPAEVAADDSWRALSLREQVAQTVIVSSDAARERSLGGGSLRGFFARYPVGGVFLGPWKFDALPSARREPALRELIAEYRAASPRPLLLLDDYEQGLGGALEGFTALPHLMALGATGSPALAQGYGRTLAAEARALGLNGLLNPVADLNLNFMNSLVATRSLGDDAARALPLLLAQLQAMQSGGLIATLKHFPGDGVDFRDQHLVTSVNTQDAAAWWRSYGMLYRQAIGAGAAAVMVGHIALPALQKQRLRGRAPPASLSAELIGGLLKGRLGFRGVVVSDALNMGGLHGYHPTPLRTQVESFKAGVDLMLWPDLEFIDAIEHGIAAGEIPRARLEDALRRIWTVRRRFGLLEGSPALPAPQSPSPGPEVATRCAEAALTRVRDRGARLPLDPSRDRRLLWVVVAPAANAAQRADHFAPSATALRERGFEVDLRVNLSFYEHPVASTDGYDRVVFAFDRHPHAPIGSVQLQEAEALTAWMANALPASRVVAVSFGDPYVHDVYLSGVDACVNAYSDGPASQRAVVRALVGEIGWPGRSPVDLAALRRRLQG